jgi:endonuclease/exonuclease/phosphatase (EEP) superfamily protein YafD
LTEILATALRWTVVLAATALAAVTLLPLSGSKAWWVRMWDFPRAQIAGGLAAAVVAIALLFGPARWYLLPLPLACLAYQLWRIRPYTPLMRTEMRFAPGEDAGHDVTILAANVLMENEQHHRLRDLIERVDPDILLLMETDQRWIEALEPVFARFPVVVKRPRDDYYGMVFATRLEARDARMVRLTADEVPAIFADLVARGGQRFRFVGLHPKPPVPGEDTDERDAEVLYAARFAAESGVPLVAAGDFNDVAWSDTAQRFKHVGGYLDPRIGRGLYSSFDANRPLFRCPIDQLYVTQDVAMVSFGRGPHFGSDHFPIIATVRMDPEAAARLNRAPCELTGSDREDVEKAVAAHRERLGPDAF